MKESVYTIKDNGVALVTLNRPEVYNAVNEEMLTLLCRQLSDLSFDKGVRVVVITGEGKVFCSGGDLRSIHDFPKGAAQGVYELATLFHQVVEEIRRMKKPVVAAINGVACAGGIETIVCCDINIAVETATFSDAHSRYGFMPGLGGGLGLARAVGPFKAKEMLFTADFFTARDMADAGLVNHVVPDDQLVTFVDELVNKLAERSPLSLARMKQLINDGLDVPWDVAVRYEMLSLEAQTHSEDFYEGIKAFNEMRSPQFKGK